MNAHRMTRLLSLITLVILVPGSAYANENASLEGLWKAYKRFDHYVEGPLLLDFERGAATLAGQRVPLEVEDGRWSVAFSAEYGRFSGQWDGTTPKAHWHQPGPIQTGAFMASPVTFRALSGGLWAGAMTPMPSHFTFYLPIRRDSDGTLRTFLRNPERNLGVFARLSRIEQDGDELRFFGSFRGSDEEQVVVNGRRQSDSDSFTLFLPPWRGGAYDFRRETDEALSDFNARDPGPWRYQAPPMLDDGWQTASLADVGIDEAMIRRMIEEEISAPANDVHAMATHGVLIARGGKLVLEEYFNGFHRDLPHDSRSAGKSLASVLVGAAMLQGADLSPATPVYAALGEDVDALEQRKRDMTLEHLLTMASGFYCDDGDGNAPGNEDTLQSQQDQPEWYRYTLDLPMADDPGERPVYCSANSNLIGAVVSARTGRPLTELVRDLVAEPLQIDQYHLNLQPTGELYFGGGSHWRARDYMKLAQMMLDGGTWNGRRIVSEQWARASVAESVRIGDRAYGWQWWINEYEWHGETVEAFFAAGNGGQIFMGVPDADLVIAFWGGNYSDRIARRAQDALIPDYILPAVQR